MRGSHRPCSYRRPSTDRTLGRWAVNVGPSCVPHQLYNMIRQSLFMKQLSLTPILPFKRPGADNDTMACSLLVLKCYDVRESHISYVHPAGTATYTSDNARRSKTYG